MRKTFSELSKKIVVISGAASGLGKSLAQAFLREGALVWNIDLQPAEISGVQDILCDLTDSEAVEQGCARLLQQTAGQIDVYIANAGIYAYESITNTSLDRVKNLFAVNVFSHYQIIQQFLPAMLSAQMAHVVLVSSDQALIGRPNNTAYGMSKAALAQLAKSLAAELSPHQIAVNCICPGTMKQTGMTDTAALAIAEEKGSSVTDVLAEFAEEMPQQELVCPDALAQWVIRLCQQKSPLLTGQSLSFDGGFTCIRL